MMMKQSLNLFAVSRNRSIFYCFDIKYYHFMLESFQYSKILINVCRVAITHELRETVSFLVRGLRQPRLTHRPADKGDVTFFGLALSRKNNESKPMARSEEQEVIRRILCVLSLAIRRCST